MFESEEEFAMDQILAAGSLSPLPGVGGETGPFLGQYQQPQDRWEAYSPAPRAWPLTPFTQRPKQTHVIESGLQLALTIRKLLLS